MLRAHHVLTNSDRESAIVSSRHFKSISSRQSVKFIINRSRYKMRLTSGSRIDMGKF